jgi:hypothetical protein
MRKPVLAGILLAVFGMLASNVNAASAQHVGMHKVCYWLPSDRTLRPLLSTNANPKVILATRNPEAARVGHARIRIAPEPRQHAWEPASPRVALVVGVAF